MYNLFVDKKIIAGVALLGLLITSTSPSLAWGFGNRHPRRAEVLGRDNRLGYDINKDRGKLRGHYGQLARQDRSIRRQEQRDARRNGGFITRGQQSQLNHEENRLHNEVRNDYR